jgi:hypothetical protein
MVAGIFCQKRWRRNIPYFVVMMFLTYKDALPILALTKECSCQHQQQVQSFPRAFCVIERLGKARMKPGTLFANGGYKKCFFVFFFYFNV